ncbi:hypothetical protein LJC32_03110 [Oscillospiraceae bacterium OttesenSCG-928-F05]|nr:hypothetical protein [Oscillospiraceae bacterium OttesenSCG-928-F05]
MKLLLALCLVVRFVLSCTVVFIEPDDYLVLNLHTTEDIVAFLCEVSILIIMIVCLKKIEDAHDDRRDYKLLFISQVIVCACALLLALHDLMMEQKINNLSQIEYLLPIGIIASGVLFITFMIKRLKHGGSRIIAAVAIFANVLMLARTLFIEMYYLLPYDTRDLLFPDYMLLLLFMKNYRGVQTLLYSTHYVFIYLSLFPRRGKEAQTC